MHTNDKGERLRYCKCGLSFTDNELDFGVVGEHHKNGEHVRRMQAAAERQDPWTPPDE